MNGWVAFWSAVLGGVITGAFSIWGIFISHKKAEERQKNVEKSLIKSLLQSLHDEIKTIWGVYQEGIGIQLEALSDDDPFLYLYPITQDYFNIYHGNSILIGKINDSNLRENIIVTYTLAKGLVDSYRFNNDMVQKYDQLQFLFRQTENSVFEQQLGAQHSALVYYARKIKTRHNEVKNRVNSLLRELQESIV